MTPSEREALLSRWSDPPSDTEQTRCDNAERVIKNAIAKSALLKDRDIRVFVQGSYRNNTNVRLDSDVDICVCLMDTFITDYTFADGLSDAALGLIGSTYPYSQFRNDLEAALVAAFGRVNVKRGNKAFDIKENTYRVDADVVACWEYRRYYQNGSYASGTALYPDNGGAIHSWPEQHRNNGVEKNNNTGRRFKRLVRIMKNLCNALTEQGNVAAKPIPSFLNECLVWNTPDHLIMDGTLSDNVRQMFIHLWQSTETDEACKKWREVNEMKYLFRPGQPWTREQAQAWIYTAWQVLEFE